VYEILRYRTANGKEIFTDWLVKLRDMKAKLAIVKRLRRLEEGNLGDHRFCGEGVWELKIDVGAGYRVYCGAAGKQILLLLCGGDKRTQSADIERAQQLWRAYQEE